MAKADPMAIPYAWYVLSKDEVSGYMNKAMKTVLSVMLLVVFAVSCTKSDGPNDGGDNEQQNDSVVDNSGTLNGHDYVDLGLPNGTLWATCNLGADTPEEYGDCFAWGETEPKELYDWKSYKYGIFFHERYELNKYCTDSVYGLDGFVDNLTLLEPADDAATTNWGVDWRMPTLTDWEELHEYTSNAWTTQNGVNGWCFTASNGNSIFLPAAGYWWDGEFNCADLGVYWSATLNTDYPNRAWSFHFGMDNGHICGSSDRNRGQTVRAVCSKK